MRILEGVQRFAHSKPLVFGTGSVFQMRRKCRKMSYSVTAEAQERPRFFGDLGPIDNGTIRFELRILIVCASASLFEGSYL